MRTRCALGVSLRNWSRSLETSMTREIKMEGKS